MNPIKKRVLSLSIAGSISVISGCSNTEFGGKAGKKGIIGPSVEADPENLKSTGGGFPEAPNIGSPGWIGDQARNDFVDIFNAGRGGGGSDDGSSSGPKGAGGGSDDSQAGAQSPGAKLLNDVDGVLWLPCDEESKAFQSKFYGKKDHKVRMSGEWCPKVDGKSEATVLFVIDRSGSMTGGGGEGPNDPTSGGSCGRLKAAEKIMEKLKNAKNAKVRAGVVTFSNGAATRVPVGSLNSVEASVNESVFCGSDPGLVAKTNYQAAFDESVKSLQGESGSKIVIFISDGSPTLYTGGNLGGAITNEVRAQSEEKGLASAEKLRGIDGVTLFALFLGYKGTGDGTAADPKGYLEKVAGGPDNVRLTKDAEGLVDAAANLGLPLDQIKISNAKGLLSNATGETKVAIEKIERHPKEEGRFIWYTEPFSFVGTPNKGEVNTLTVSASASSGEKLKTVSEITFFQQD
jgi:hypothetical protein